MSTVNFTSEWTLESNDNLDAYLEALGVEPERRAEFLNPKPVWNIEHNGKEMKVYIPRHKKTSTSNIGEEAEWRLLDGSTQRNVPYWDGDRLVRSGLTSKGIKHESILEIKDDMLVKTLIAGEVVCVRKFKKTN